MDKDVFINNNNQQKTLIQSSNNFFLQENSNANDFVYSEPSKRLNNFDADILRDDAYKKIDDEVFKLEYKISKTEENIKKIKDEIVAAKDICDYELAGTLSGRKLLLETELEELTNLYNSKSIAAKISDGFTSKLKNRTDVVKNGFLNIGRKIFSLLPKRFSSFIEIKHSLKTLETINESVDELMSMQVPYGEAAYRYNRLSKYITRANALQSHISKQIK